MSERMKMAYGPSDLKHTDGTQVSTDRVGNQNDQMVSQLHGSMHEVATRGQLFCGSNQAAVTSTIALATTYTGLCLSNPAGNTKDLVLRQVGIALSVAPAGIAPIGLGGGWSTAGIATHTTPLIAYNQRLGGPAAATGLIDGAATLVAGAGQGLLRVILPVLGGFTAAATPSTSPSLIDMQGSVVIPPGGFVFIYTLTVVVGLFGFTWQEVPR
jgi:hypothetical protein